MLDRLPYREIWAVDFEFIQAPGERPDPVCLVARELHSDRLIRLWRDEFGPRPPFPVDDGSLFVAYMAAAELGCFLELGWPLPLRVFDPYVEFRAIRNGGTSPNGFGLLGALAHYGIPGISKAEKDAGRAAVMKGPPWSPTERAAILDYCQTDVDPLGRLVEAMLPAVASSTRRWGQALLRGRYMGAVANMERTGVPVDVDTYAGLVTYWNGIKSRLISAVDQDYGVYDGVTFKEARFRRWLAGHQIGSWPETATGLLALDGDTFRDMAKTHPELHPLKELRHALGEMRLSDLQIGADGRNRTSLFPFGSKTGRNQPSNTKFIFGPAVWMRSLIRPEPGRALAYIDWSAQEVAIAAALSGDQALRQDVETGDPYLAFAKRSGLAPRDATKQSHPQVREACKACVLGVNYGMQAYSLGQRLGISLTEAEFLLYRHTRAYPRFAEWSEDVVNRGFLGLPLTTVLGWPIRVPAGTRETQLRNFPMQANGAEMLRVACMLATEAGLEVCAPVHDALLVEGEADDIDGVIESVGYAMTAAAEAVLGGLTVKTDATVVAWPERYSDPRGAEMWARVTELLADPGPVPHPVNCYCDECLFEGLFEEVAC